MKSIKLLVLTSLLTAGSLSMVSAVAAAEDSSGAVFVMNNAAVDNQIAAYARQEDGALWPTGSYSTGGNGSGGTVDPLHSQGSLLLSTDHRLLFAVNAGSGSISSFAVWGSHLSLVDTQSSGGSSPTAIAQDGELLYVLNAGGNGNVSGFHVGENGRLWPIENSTRNLSGTATSPTSIAFSPDRRFLVVTESATNNIDVFRVHEDGTLSAITVNASADTVPFAPVFAPDGALIVASASNAVSSYWILPNQTLKVISASLPTLGKATCWDVITRHGRLVYTSNAGSSSISGFKIWPNGSLSPIGATVVASNPAGSTNLDIAASANGKYVYTLNTGTGAIGEFSVESDGALSGIGAVDGLPASAGLNGIAAY
ncbi:MAG: beta-propeller fold lactonase family protein [Terracidiphilus sp.]|jgi:6-phosphogluconolactonase (cycloisomerase 2 family)